MSKLRNANFTWLSQNAILPKKEPTSLVREHKTTIFYRNLEE